MAKRKAKGSSKSGRRRSSSKLKPKNWRTFEQLTAMIESHLGPKGAVVKSPDHILDKRTGKLREVDVSIRYHIGSAPILVTIECRDRSTIQDVAWIDQIATKRDAIGASCTIAVSSRGFSENALRAAAQHEIQARVLRTISDATVRAWADQLQMTVGTARHAIKQVGLNLRPTATEAVPKLSTATATALEQSNGRAKIFTRTRDGERVGIDDLLRDDDAPPPIAGSLTVTVPPMSATKITLKTGYEELYKDIPPNGGPVDCAVEIDLKPGDLSVESTSGIAVVDKITVSLTLEVREIPVAFSTSEYSAPSGIARHVAHANVDLGGQQIRIVSAEEKTNSQAPPVGSENQ